MMHALRALASLLRNVLENKMSLIPAIMTQGMIISFQQARIFSAIRDKIPALRLIKPLERRRQSALVRASTWASAVAQLALFRDGRFRKTDHVTRKTNSARMLLSFLRK
jgi:hypothetical protein